MTKVLIIEDEQHAQQRLIQLLKKLAPEFEVVDVIDNVENSVKWLSTFQADLIFSDIQLADGISFDIFDKVKVETPVIFTTAYDQYAIKAFRINSIDYLLKPILEEDLQRSIQKFKNQNIQRFDDKQTLLELMKELQTPNYTERFLVKLGRQLKYIPSDEIAYCFSEASMLFIVTRDGNKYLYDKSVDQMEHQLRPRSCLDQQRYRPS